MTQELLRRVLALYTPPFRYERGTVYFDDNTTAERGYIFDACGRSVGDNLSSGAEPTDLILRVRCWGRLTSEFPQEEAIELHDAIGELIVLALNEFWEKAR